MHSRDIQTFSIAQKQFCWSGIGVRTTASADRSMAPHRHSFFQIFFVADGSAVHEIGDRVYHATPGSIFFVSPYTVHRVVFPADSECYVLYFSAQFLQPGSGFEEEVAVQEPQLYRFPELAPFIYQTQCSYQLDETEIDVMREHCRRIERSCADRGMFDAAKARAELTLLMTMVGSKYLARFKEIEQVNGADRLLDRRARAAISFLKAHYKSRGLTLADVAKEVHLTGTYLTQLLKQETGKSFKQILDGLRLENSKTLLAYTDASMQRIAMESGFNDQAHFAKRFKAYAQLTPGQFRKLHHAPMRTAEQSVIAEGNRAN